MVVVLITPALIPPGGHCGPAPYLAEVKRSAELAGAPGDTPLSGDLILRHARIVDANGARGPTSIRVDGGRITAIGTRSAPSRPNWTSEARRSRPASSTRDRLRFAHRFGSSGNSPGIYR